MLIYETLKKDHQTVKSLLNELTVLDEDSENRSDLIEKIRSELIPHARAEEAVFYNSLRAVPAAQDVVMHAYQEHIEAETLLKTLQLKDKIDADWKKTANKLKEALEHHISEEEGRVFTVAQEVFSAEEATQFNEAFEKMKEEVKDESFAGTTMDLIANLMPPRFMKAIRGDKANPSTKR